MSPLRLVEWLKIPKVKATGTVNAREFEARKQYEGPVSLLQQLAPDQTMVLPGDYTTATRLRD